MEEDRLITQHRGRQRAALVARRGWRHHGPGAARSAGAGTKRAAGAPLPAATFTRALRL